MSENEGPGQAKSGFGTGCIIAAVLAGVGLLLVILLVAAGAAAFYYKAQAPASSWVPPTPPAAAADDSTGEDDAGAGDEEAAPEVVDVLVKLAGVGPNGVKYRLNDEEECVGEAALVARLKELGAGGEDQAPATVIVDLDVATASGITQAQVDAAVKACWTAGAAVRPPPDLST